MSFATPGRLRPAAAILAVCLSAALVLGLGPTAAAEPSGEPDMPVPTASTVGDYVVTLADAPVAAYDGGVAGYDATQPAAGEDVDTASADAKRYRSYLRTRQDRVAARVGAKPRKRYDIAVAAFTSAMTGQQAARLAGTDGVLSVSKNTLRPGPDDRRSTDFLGLTGHHGVWAKLGGKAKAGRGVVVGVIDSGIWPESASFAGAPLPTSRGTGKKARFAPRRAGDQTTLVKSDGGRFTGTCQTGEEFTVEDCNTKLIGARYFGDAWLARVPADQRDDYVSPRDGEGHGSHVSSIAAGNAGVRAVVDGQDFGTISGVAPAAKIASYKVLWQAKDPTQSGAYDSDVLAAIDAAITDGVDVLNFSVTAADNPASPVQLAFLAAASAGIFVAASAGNSGPDASTVQSTAPWVTTVGAHTIAPYYGTVTLGNGQAYAGISTSVTAPVGSAPLVNGSALAAVGQTAESAAVCAPGSLNPTQAAGKVVVCDRGGVDRTVKSTEVERAGGIGMVLANLSANTLDADLHRVPTVHVDPPASTDIKAYAATPEATARLTEGNQTATSITYPQIATFSSRGPSLGTGGDTLKPDLVAPGVSTLGAVAPASNDRDFGFISGTSQSAPQVAGLAALWFGAGVRPRWSPMLVKSALMTTAADLHDGSGKKVADPFAQGAGRVVPERMFSPGLVFPATDRDWLAYLEGLGLDTGTKVRAQDPSDYNAPSIAIGRLAGTQTVTRRVTAVAPGRYRVAVAVPGVKVKVRPEVLSFDRAGQTKTFKVTFTRTTAAFERATSGFLTWSSKAADVRVPLVLTPQRLEAPARVSRTGGTGRISYRVRPGESGAFTATPFGLASGAPRTGTRPLEAGENLQLPVSVPAGTKAARFTAEAATAGANVDLYVYQAVNGSTVLVGHSATTSARESVLLTLPAAGTYVAVIQNVGNPSGTSSTSVVLRTGLAEASTGQGGFTVEPGQTVATAGREIGLTARWSGLEAGVPYVGWIEYPGGQGTAVLVN